MVISLAQVRLRGFASAPQRPFELESEERIWLEQLVHASARSGGRECCCRPTAPPIMVAEAHLAETAGTAAHARLTFGPEVVRTGGGRRLGVIAAIPQARMRD